MANGTSRTQQQSTTMQSAGNDDIDARLKPIFADVKTVLANAEDDNDRAELTDDLLDFLHQLYAEQPPLPDIPHSGEALHSERKVDVAKMISTPETRPKTEEAPHQQVDLPAWISDSEEERMEDSSTSKTNA